LFLDAGAEDDDSEGGGGHGRRDGRKGRPAILNPLVCDVCHTSGRMIYCDDECNQVYHMQCINLTTEPPLDQSWSCQHCIDKIQTCFLCKQQGKSTDQDIATQDPTLVKVCSIAGCGHFFHIKCAKDCNYKYSISIVTNTFVCFIY
jgi:hypothetical protein